MLSTGKQNSWTHRPWQRLNFFLASLLSLSPLGAVTLVGAGLVAAALVGGDLVAATLVVGGLVGATLEGLVGMVVLGLDVDLTSTVLGRFKSRSKVFSDSLGLLGACLSVTASGTAGTGMN